MFCSTAVWSRILGRRGGRELLLQGSSFRTPPKRGGFPLDGADTTQTSVRTRTGPAESER